MQADDALQMLVDPLWSHSAQARHITLGSVSPPAAISSAKLRSWVSKTRFSARAIAAGLRPRARRAGMVGGGRVSLNGLPIRSSQVRADPFRDRVTVDGRPLSLDRALLLPDAEQAQRCAVRPCRS